MATLVTGCRPVDNGFQKLLKETLRDSMTAIGLIVAVSREGSVFFENSDWSWQFHLDPFSSELHDSLVRGNDQFSLTELLRFADVQNWESYRSPIVDRSSAGEGVVEIVSEAIRRVVESGFVLDDENFIKLIDQKRLFEVELERSSRNLAARRTAEMAWRARDYRACLEAYRKVGSDLTALEKRRLEFCATHLHS